MKAIVLKYWWVALVVLAVCVFGVQRCSNNKLKDELQLKSVQLSAMNDSVTFHKGKNGDLISIIRADVVEKDNLKQALLDAGLSSASELRKNDIKWRDLTEALRLKYEASNHSTMALHDTLWKTKTDTIHGQIGKWNDRYLFLNQTIQPGSSDLSYF